MNKQTAKAEGDSAKYRDLSLPELFDMFPDDRAAMEWLEENVCRTAAGAALSKIHRSIRPTTPFQSIPT